MRTLEKMTQIFSLAAGFCISLFLLLYALPDVLQQVERASENYPYVDLNPWIVFSIAFAPTLLIFSAAGLAKVMNLMPAAIAGHMLPLLLWGGVAAALAGIGSAVAGRHYLSAHGYHPCSPMSDLSVMSGTVWLHDPDHCLTNSGLVRSELQNWFDIRFEHDSKIDAAEVDAEVKRLLAQRTASP